MKRQIGLIILINMMSSILQPAWSMEEDHGNSTSVVLKQETEREKEQEGLNINQQLQENTKGVRIGKTELADLDGEDLKVVNTILEPIENAIKLACSKLEKLPLELRNFRENPSQFPDVPSFLRLEELLVKMKGMKKIEEEKVCNHIENLPVEVTSYLIREFVFSQDAFAFARTCQLNLTIVYDSHPAYQDLELFLSEGGYFDRKDNKTRSEKIWDFYQARRQNDPKTKFLMGRFLNKKAKLARTKAVFRLYFQSLSCAKDKPRECPLSSLFDVPPSERSLKIRSIEELKDLNDCKEAVIFLFRHYHRYILLPKKNREEDELKICSYVEGMEYTENPLLLYKVARAILAHSFAPDSIVRKIVQLQEWISKQNEEDKALNRRQRVKLWYLLRLCKQNGGTVNLRTFNPCEIEDLIKINKGDSQHQLYKNHILAAKFASFLYWGTGLNKVWLDFLPLIDKSGQENIHTWVPIDLYLCRFYLVHPGDTTLDNSKLSISNMYIKDVTSRFKIINFYYGRALARCSNDRKLPQDYELFFQETKSWKEEDLKWQQLSEDEKKFRLTLADAKNFNDSSAQNNLG